MSRPLSLPDLPAGADAGPPAGTVGAPLDDDATRVYGAADEAPLAPARADEASAAPARGSANDGLAHAAAPPAQTLPGSTDPHAPAARKVGRFLIRERLGRGGMATVFKAHDPGIGRDVAIKFLHAALCEDAEYRGRFLREARAAGSLAHPNIVTVFDVGEIEGRPYMAMELVAGDSLADLMAAGRPPLPLRDVLVMGIQLATALDYAHAHGIVHRDIKPGNIVRLHGTNTVKVMDFGIARIEAGGAGDDEQRTRVGDVLGTPQYMSPEQTQGERLDGRSDLFSAGVVLYQLLTGRRPFQGEGLVALALKIAKEEPPPIESLRPEVPGAVRRIVARCLAKQPARRWQSGAELADALIRALAEHDEANGRRTRPRIVPLQVKWAATMALVVAVVMGVSATLITERQFGAMTEQVTDYGASLARFIAAQNAVAALSEDWPVVDVAVQGIMKTGDFESVTVIDRDGIVRGSADAAQVGQAYRPRAAVPLGRRADGVATSRYRVNGDPVLGFEAPILFRDRPVGRVALGIAERPLVRVARLSMGLMAGLVLVTVAAVATAMVFVAKAFAQPIRLIGEAMDEVAKGRFDHRIAETRKDELGLLFASFDRMVAALQDAASRGATRDVPALTPTPSTSTSHATSNAPRTSELAARGPGVTGALPAASV